MALIPTRKTYPQLTAQSLPIQDGDILAGYRSPGPLKRFTASNLRDYLANTFASSAALAAGTGAAQVGYQASGGTTRTQSDKNSDVVSVKDFGATNNSAQIAAAIAALDTSGGKCATLVFPAGTWAVSSSITLPARVKVRGAGPNATQINQGFSGPVFITDSTSENEISDLRIGLGVSGHAAIDIRSTTSSVFRGLFRNLQIAGVAGQAGFVGIKAITTGANIITDMVVDNVDFIEVDQPIVEIGPEGNFWTKIKVDQFGYSASSVTASISGSTMTVTGVSSGAILIGHIVQGSGVAPGTMVRGFGTGTGGTGTYTLTGSQTVGSSSLTTGVAAIASQGLASEYTGRIAGTVGAAASRVGVALCGTTQSANFVVDCGPSTKAVSVVADGENKIQIQRPEGLTPLGDAGYGNFVYDNATAYMNRVRPTGPEVLVGQFGLTGFGASSFVTVLKGNENFVEFLVSARGPGAATNPSIVFNWINTLDVAPLGVTFGRNGGNQPKEVAFQSQTANTGGCSATWLATPVDTEDYVFTIRRDG